MKKILFKGCGTAIVTPFTSSGINYKELENLIEYQINNKADAIIVCGTAGESATMTKQEKIDVIKFTVNCVNGRIPVIAGTGSNNTKQAVLNSKTAESLGVDGVLVVTPYYNKCTQQGLINHFKLISESITIPIVLYNVQSRTGVNIEPKTCYELSKIENIVAIKEASGNISQVAEISELCGKSLAIYSGNDDQILPVLSLGGSGVISVLGNIKPELVHNMIFSFLKGDLERARKLQLESIKLIKVLFSEVNPIPVKSALNILGFNVGNPRLPLTSLTENNYKILKELLV